MVISHLLEVVLILTLRYLLKRENDKRNMIRGLDIRGEISEGEVVTDENVEEKRRKELDATAFADLTDRENLNFRYIY